MLGCNFAAPIRPVHQFFRVRRRDTSTAAVLAGSRHAQLDEIIRSSGLGTLPFCQSQAIVMFSSASRGNLAGGSHARHQRLLRTSRTPPASGVERMPRTSARSEQQNEQALRYSTARAAGDREVCGQALDEAQGRSPGRCPSSPSCSSRARFFASAGMAPARGRKGTRDQQERPELGRAT